MTELIDLPLTKIVQLLRVGKISSQELAQSYLTRIDKFNQQLNIFLTVLPEDALMKKAALADNMLSGARHTQNSELPLLTGVPFGIKDILCVEDLACTCGSRILENFVPTYNATSVQRLFDSGAFGIGKTNMDEFAMGSSTENSAFGPTRNPWNLNRVPGGSSGGSAASVAVDMIPFALGTDTGGSVRQPASFCGISGLKPTYGRVSRYGLVAFGSSLDVVGVLGRYADDIALVFEIIAGYDPKDSTSIEEPQSGIQINRYTKAGKERPLEGLKIGLPDEYFIAGIQPAVKQAIMDRVKLFESLGASIIQISLPHTEYALPVYYIIAPSEASANLARYDGVRYGKRTSNESLIDQYRKTRGEYFGAEVKRRIMLGTYALSAGYYDAYYIKAQKVRTLIKSDFNRVFNEVDLIAAPVSPTTAFPLGEHTNDPLAMYLEDIFTLPANLAGIPSLAFPIGFDNNSLPIGMQLMAPELQEPLLLQITHLFQQVTDWHKYRPELTAIL